MNEPHTTESSLTWRMPCGNEDSLDRIYRSLSGLPVCSARACLSSAYAGQVETYPTTLVYYKLLSLGSAAHPAPPTRNLVSPGHLDNRTHTRTFGSATGWFWLQGMKVWSWRIGGCCLGWGRAVARPRLGRAGSAWWGWTGQCYSRLMPEPNSFWKAPHILRRQRAIW